MNIYLGKHFEEMIREKVASGRYANASEVVREALRLYEIDEEKLTRLRAKIAESDAQFERGEGIVVTDLRAFFDEIKRRAIERAQTRESVSANANS
jgi:antitoxin ParD1/3/4